MLLRCDAMRHLVPPKAICRDFVAAMVATFDEPNLRDVRAAFAPVCAFFQVAVPRFRWQNGAERRRNYAHMLYVEGRGTTIALTHPKHWVENLDRNGPHEWAFDALHELDHVLKIPQQERRAESFARAFMDRALS